MTIEEFIGARLDEDETAANAALDAVGGPWEIHGGSLSVDSQPFGVGYGEGDLIALRHCLRHEPARVLREITAKRRALHSYVIGDDVAMWPTVTAIAAIWSDHPDFNPAWSS